MKKYIILCFSIFSIIYKANANITPIDSLKQQLQVTVNDTAKAGIYTQLAGCYMEFKNAPNAYSRRIYQENAINYTMLAMHLYYKFDDTTGMVNSYRNLSKIYRSQRLYAQAKWFTLQANTLARRLKSNDGVATTLVELAAIKMDIKDYDLARKDLKEAYVLIKKNNLTEQDSLARLAYNRLYTYIKVQPKDNIFSPQFNIKAWEPKVVPAKRVKAKAKLASNKKAPASKKRVYTVLDKTMYATQTLSL